MLVDEARASSAEHAAALVARGTAHDHRNRMQSISSALNLIRARVATGRVSEVLALADAAEHLLQGVGDPTSQLLSLVCPSADDAEPIELNEAITQMRPVLEALCGPSIELLLRPARASAGVWCDARLLENAVINMVINARDAITGSGSIILAISLVAEVAAGRRVIGPCAAVMVTDDGCGMSEEVIASAFQPRFTTKKSGQGSGLGLMMARLFAEQSGGTVELQSVIGGGTTISLLLPTSSTATPSSCRDSPSLAVSGA